jgi:hypothetical protein
MATRALSLLASACLAVTAAAQEQRAHEEQVAPPAGQAAGQGPAREVAVPSPPPPGPVDAEVVGRFRSPAGAPKDTSRLGQARLISSEAGVARLQFGEGIETVKPGSVIGGDVVRSVSARQIVLDRAASGPDRPEATVIASFGADGRARVRVFFAKDPLAATQAPEAR